MLQILQVLILTMLVAHLIELLWEVFLGKHFLIHIDALDFLNFRIKRLLIVLLGKSWAIGRITNLPLIIQVLVICSKVRLS